MSGWREMVAEALRETAPSGDALEAVLPIAKTAKTAKTPETGAEPVAVLHPTADDLAERAAIVEEGAKVPREWAEGFARISLAPCPRGVAFSDWRAMIDAAGRFLDAWGGAAAALGWSAGDLFSLDPAAPLARRDRRGAAFFMAGAEVVAVTAEAITLRRPCSSTRPRGETHHRLLRGSGSLGPPAWETESAVIENGDPHG